MRQVAYTLERLIADMRRITAEGASEHETIAALRPLVRQFALSGEWREPRLYQANREQGFGAHLLHDEPDHSLAVFAASWLPGRGAPPHDHGVWAIVVNGVDAGKPLPMVRRATLSIEDCEFVPRVMAVPAGTTINLFSSDRATYTTRFYREGAADPVAVAHTVDAGQVVPSEDVAKQAGMVEVRRTEQDWARGYVAVFDHPYFAVSDASGNFTIDSLPPGTYTLKIWHEGLERPAEQRVTVTSGGIGRVDLSLTPPADPPPSR